MPEINYFKFIYINNLNINLFFSIFILFFIFDLKYYKFNFRYIFKINKLYLK